MISCYRGRKGKPGNKSYGQCKVKSVTYYNQPEKKVSGGSYRLTNTGCMQEKHTASKPSFYVKKSWLIRRPLLWGIGRPKRLIHHDFSGRVSAVGFILLVTLYAAGLPNSLLGLWHLPPGAYLCASLANQEATICLARWGHQGGYRVRQRLGICSPRLSLRYNTSAIQTLTRRPPCVCHGRHHLRPWELSIPERISNRCI